MSMKKSINDASHRRGLMNEAVKIGSYEDDDYYASCIRYPASCIRYPVSRNSRIHTQTHVPSFYT